MKNKVIFSLDLIKKISQMAGELNVPVYAVGGFVRDYLLGKSSKDIDILIVGDGPAFAQALADRLKVKNVSIYKNFGTAMLSYRGKTIEVAGARKESYRQDSRKPQVNSADLMTDLTRRDLTINSIAISLNQNDFGHVVDPFDGRKDLQQGIIRTPLEPEQTFYDDPLRILRAIRFAAQLHFIIDEKTLTGIREERERLKIVSQERITDEIGKILACNKPSIGLKLMESTKVLDIVLPEIAALKGVDQVGAYQHKDVFDHTLKVVDNVARVSDQIALRWAALFHDVAKPVTKEFKPELGWTFHGHEEIGARMMAGIGRRMRLSQNLIEYVQKLIRLHLRPIHLSEEGVTDSAIRRLIFQGGAELDDLITLCRADITSRNVKRVKKHLANFDLVVQRMQEVEEKDRLRQFQPPVRGEEIMQAFNLSPGPLVGKIKKAIEEAILNGEIPNEHDAANEYMVKVGKQICNSQ
ncbi:HD domain-containing protein [candidate division KSB1 bacterium]|nr:HD domain-containing protein [candidate division KSB1 bacterium]